MSAMLAIPRISQQVPQVLVQPSKVAQDARLSHFLLEAGVIEEYDLPVRWEHSLQAFEHALKNWVRRMIGPLHCLQPHFCLAVENTNSWAYSQEPEKPVQPYRTLVLLWWNPTPEQVTPVGKRLQMLNDSWPDLGAIVFEILRQQSGRVYPLFTPDIAQDICSMLYWCGEEDESVVLDEYETAEEREEVRQHILTRERVESASPKFSRRWTSNPCSNEEYLKCLHAAVACGTADPCAEIARTALELTALDLPCRCDTMPELDGEFIGFAGVLTWDEDDDVTVEVFEDFVNMAYQAEHFDCIGLVQMDVEQPQAMQRWHQDMQPTFAAIGLIDRLIWQLCEGN